MNACHCLCAMHRQFNTVTCRGRRDFEVRMGSLRTRHAVPMCSACAVWWQESDPQTSLWPFVRIGDL